MKRKRHICAVLLCALVLAGLFTACGSSSNTAAADSAGSGNSSSVPYDDALADEMGWAADTENSVTDSTSETAPSGSEILSQEKIIRTASMEMETQAFDDAVAALDQLVEELEGYCESRSIRQHSTYRSASFTVRVPAASFDAFLDQAGQAAHVTWQDESQENVGESYYDIEARLATQRTKQERLLALLEEAATMEDIIDLENALSETELQIEYLTGSLRQYDSLISYSTITVSLQEVYRLSSEEEPALTFPQRLGAAFSAGLRSGIEGLEDLAVGIARNWVGLLIAAGVIAAVVLGLRRRKRRRNPPAPPAASEDSAANP